MSQNCVVGVYESFEDAGVAVRALDASGFPHDQVSLVTFQVTDHLEKPATVQPDEGADKATAMGAATGGLLGLLLGAPLLAIPGVGPALVGGPLAVGLTGALVGGLLGSMKGWGVPEDHIAKYQQLVDEGNVMVVASGTPSQVANALQILQPIPSIELNAHLDPSADAQGGVVRSDAHR